MAEIAPLDGGAYHSRMSGLDTGSVRVIATRESGGLRLRTSWRDDALGAYFAVRLPHGKDRERIEAPLLVVACSGTELRTSQGGDLRTFRVSVRAGALDELAARLEGDVGLEPWLRAGLRRPRARAAAEARLLQAIVKACAHVERATARGVDIDALVNAFADDVVVKLADVLADGGDVGARGPESAAARRRLADAAVELLLAADDMPLSTAAVCRRLDTSERTLQRAFCERFGHGLQAYERELRLRRVHWALVVEGAERTVTDIAMSFGFWHLGRFAGAYAALYGCSPSETRRRAWGDDGMEELAESG